MAIFQVCVLFNTLLNKDGKFTEWTNHKAYYVTRQNFCYGSQCQNIAEMARIDKWKFGCNMDTVSTVTSTLTFIITAVSAVFGDLPP